MTILMLIEMVFVIISEMFHGSISFNLVPLLLVNFLSGFRLGWNSVLNKSKSAIPPQFNSLEVLSAASDKAKLFAENFSMNSNLDDSGISLPCRTNLKLQNISVRHLVLIVFQW